MEEYFAGKNINRHYYSVFEDVVKAVKTVKSVMASCRLKILPPAALRKFMTLCAAMTAISLVKNA